MTTPASRVTAETIEEMLAGLEGVTRGPWVKGRRSEIAPVDGPSHEVGSPTRGVGMSMYAIDAEHIARCDPGTIRSILTELQSLRSLSSDSVSDGSKGDDDNAAKWRESVEAMLSSGDPDVVRCHEGGGPESLIGSLVLTMMRTRNSRDKALDSGTGGQPPVRWEIIETLPSGASRWCVVEHENHAREVAKTLEFPTTVRPLYSSPTEPKAGVVSEPWTRQDLAEGLALLDGVNLQRIKSSVGPEDDANKWRKYLGDADDLLAHLSMCAAIPNTTGEAE